MQKLSLIQRASMALTVLRKGALDDLFPNRGEHLGSFRAGSVNAIPSGYSYLSAINDYASYVWLYKAVKYIADAVAPLELQVWANKKPVDNHPLLDLYRNVNDTMTSADIWRQWTVDMLLAGESGQELVKGKSGKYVELWPRQPHTIGIKADPAGIRYYRVANFVIDDGKGDPYKLPPEEMCFFKFYSPKDPWRGLSPISAARMSITIDKLAQSWSADFYVNGARPDFAITAPQGSTKTERDQLKRELKAQHQGRAMEPIVLEEGISDIKMLSYPPKDMIWMEHRNMSRDEVAAIFGLPDIIMGFGNDSYDTEDKRRVAEKAAWSMTIKPLVDFRDNRLTEYWRRLGVLGPKDEVKTNLSEVSALRMDLDSKLTQMERLWSKAVPFNKLDTLLELGIGPIDGGDVGYLPAGLMPIYGASGDVIDGTATDVTAGGAEVQALALNGAQIASLVEIIQAVSAGTLAPDAAIEILVNAFPAIPLESIQRMVAAASSLQLPASVDNTQPPPTNQPPIKVIASQIVRRELRDAGIQKSETPLVVKAGATIEYGSDTHKALDAEFVKRATRRERAFGQMSAALIEKQRAEVLGKLGGGKSIKSAEDVAKNPFDKRKWKREFIKSSTPIYEKVVDDAGTAAINDVATGVDFNLLDPNVTRFIEGRSQRFAQRVNDTTWDTLKASLSQGIKDGESIAQLEVRINNIMDLRVNQSSESIARTEVIGASNGGMLEGWRQSDVVKRKQWLATMSDDRTRETHVEAHGQEVALDDDFEVGEGSGPAPGQIGLASEDIQCRCTMLAVVD